MELIKLLDKLNVLKDSDVTFHLLMAKHQMRQLSKALEMHMYNSSALEKELEMIGLSQILGTKP